MGHGVNWVCDRKPMFNVSKILIVSLFRGQNQRELGAHSWCVDMRPIVLNYGPLDLVSLNVPRHALKIISGWKLEDPALSELPMHGSVLTLPYAFFLVIKCESCRSKAWILDMCDFSKQGPPTPWNWSHQWSALSKYRTPDVPTRASQV